MNTYTFEDPQYVQFFLDSLGPMESFKVIFQKQDGTQGQFVGHLDPNSTSRKTSVPVMTEDGWKRFDVSRVLHIGYHEGEDS